MGKIIAGSGLGTRRSRVSLGDITFAAWNRSGDPLIQQVCAWESVLHIRLLCTNSIRGYTLCPHNSKRSEATRTRNNCTFKSPVGFTFLFKNLQRLPNTFRIQSKFLYQALQILIQTHLSQLYPTHCPKIRLSVLHPAHCLISALATLRLHTSTQLHPACCARPGAVNELPIWKEYVLLLPSHAMPVTS